MVKTRMECVGDGKTPRYVPIALLGGLTLDKVDPTLIEWVLALKGLSISFLLGFIGARYNLASRAFRRSCPCTLTYRYCLLHYTLKALSTFVHSRTLGRVHIALPFQPKKLLNKRAEQKQQTTHLFIRFAYKNSALPLRRLHCSGNGNIQHNTIALLHPFILPTIQRAIPETTNALRDDPPQLTTALANSTCEDQRIDSAAQRQVVPADVLQHAVQEEVERKPVRVARCDLWVRVVELGAGRDFAEIRRPSDRLPPGLAVEDVLCLLRVSGTRATLYERGRVP